MKPLRIAVTKGRLEQKTIELFEKMGCDCSEVRNKGRRLILPVPDLGAEIVLAKAQDVITYVEHGVCDIGIVGKDTIMESGGSFFEVLDLGFGKCRFAIAGQGEEPRVEEIKVVASKYPNVTRKYFESRLMDIDVVKIEGSVELAPLLGLADAIVDIVETGTTLKENGLYVWQSIADISARVIVNTAAMKLRKQEMESIFNRAEAVINAGH